MLNALSAAGPVAIVSILVKTVAYAATLLAAGSAIALVTLRSLPQSEPVALRRIAVAAALIAGVDTALRLPVRASFLMGGTWEGAFEPGVLAIVLDSPLGSSVLIRLVGLALICALIFEGLLASRIAAVGAVITAVSFALRGHALNEPRLLLGALVTVHLVGLAFWIGVFAPLYRIAGEEPSSAAGALAEEFGAKALWAVGALVLAGLLTLGLLGVAKPAAMTTPYGQMFLVKLGLFAGVLALAALNKLRLAPDLLAGIPGAGTRLRRSIGVESILIAAILATTAAITTVTSPPREQVQAGKRTVALASAIHSTENSTWLR